MAFIRTIMGDITPEEFGVCDAHEHLFRAGGPEVDHDKDFKLDDYEASVKEVQEWYECGGRSMVLMVLWGVGEMCRIQFAWQNILRGKYIL